jgi:hypothetical protein
MMKNSTKNEVSIGMKRNVGGGLLQKAAYIMFEEPWQQISCKFRRL